MANPLVPQDNSVSFDQESFHRFLAQQQQQELQLRREDAREKSDPPAPIAP